MLTTVGAGDDATLQTTLDLAISLERVADNTHRLDTQCIKSVHSKNVDHNSPVRHSEDTPHAGKCYSCGGSHERCSCKFAEARCFKCQLKEHIAKVRHSRGPTVRAKLGQSHCNATKQHFVEEPAQVENNEQAYQLFHATSSKSEAYKVTLQVDGVATTWEIDTGASLSIMPENMYK